MNRRFPHDAAAEAATLGSMLIEPQAIDVAMSLLQPSDFFYETNRVLFETMTQLHQDKKPVDPITVETALKERRTGDYNNPDETWFDRIGRARLYDLPEAPSTAFNIRSYVEPVRRTSLRRQVMEKAKNAFFLAKADADCLEKIATSNGMYDLKALAGITTGQEMPRSLKLSDVQPERTEWLWHGYLPLGMVTIICGDGGVGKGTFTLELAARITKGEAFPLLSLPNEPGNVLLVVTAEEDLKRTVIPRLMAAGADLSRVIVPDDEEEPYKFPQRIPHLRCLIEQYRPRFVLIDPMESYLSEGLSIKDGQDVRKMTMPLKALAEEFRCAILIVHHQNRNSGAQASARVSGSSAIRNSVRALFFVGKPPDEEPSSPKRILACDKMNVSKFPPSLSFSIEETTVHYANEWQSLPRIVWHGTSDCTANDLVTPSLLSREKPEDAEPSKTEQARRFLREALKEGARAVSVINREAADLGFSRKVLEKAREGMTTTRRVGGVAGAGYWEIVLSEPADTDAETSLSSPETTNLPCVPVYREQGEIGNLGEDRQGEQRAEAVAEFFADTSPNYDEGEI